MELRKTEFEVQKQHSAQGAWENRKIRVNSALYARFDDSFYSLSIARNRVASGRDRGARKRYAQGCMESQNSPAFDAGNQREDASSRVGPPDV
jgi:hypothetical protein